MFSNDLCRMRCKHKLNHHLPWHRLVATRNQPVASVPSCALFVGSGLLVRAQVSSAEAFCHSIRQVKMVWARRRTLMGPETVKSDHLKQIGDLLAVAAQYKVAKLIQKGVINKEDVIFEGDDTPAGAAPARRGNPATHHAAAAAAAAAAPASGFRTEQSQTAEAIAAVDRQILKDIQVRGDGVRGEG